LEGLGMPNLHAHLSKRREHLVALLLLPLLVVLAVLVFAWPAARVAPRVLPVGIVGTSSTAERALTELSNTQQGSFSFRLYANESSARTAILDRQIYGAFEITPTSLTVFNAGAASPVVAQLLTAVGHELASVTHPGATPLALKSVDVVPTSASDPRGLVLSAAILPLTICSILIALAVTQLHRRRPRPRQLAHLIGASVIGGLGAYVIAQGFLGALPHQPLATWAGFSLTILAISASTSAALAVLGPAGLGLSAAVMVFVGNPFSGVTSAPQLLPTAVDRIGQWLPPGAGASLIRNTAYFDGHAVGGHLAVLIAWATVGLAVTWFRGVRGRKAGSLARDTVMVAVEPSPIAGLAS
jgi:hypothetical protein